MIINVCVSFANAVTLNNMPTGASGRKVFRTYQAGTTNGLLQILETETAIFSRIVTGFINVSFDSSGNITYPNLNTDNWYKIEKKVVS